MAKAESSAKSTTKAARTPSPYNKFMKEEIARVKKANPELGHKEAFKLAAANWKTSKENPKASA